MTKTVCAVCTQKKAKRKCEKKRGQLICPLCCAEIRNTDCEDCRYYKAADKHMKTKINKSQKRKFMVEINEEAEKTVDDALIWVERGQLDKGEKLLRELQIKYPDYYMVHFGIGMVHAMRKQHEEAIKYLTKVTDTFPLFLEAHFNKAIVYKNKYDVKNMVRSLEEVIAIGDPEDELVKKANGIISNLEQGILASSNISLERYIEAQDIFDAAFSHMENGEWQKAIVGYKKSLAIDPRHTQSYGNLGICHAKLGRKSEALAMLDKALEMDPDYEPAMVNKIAVESLKEGEKLDREEFMPIEYYKDYPLKKKSFTEEVYEKLVEKTKQP